jgi:hypothetical protein
MPVIAAPWKSWQKILFRFSFLLLSLLSLVAYNPLFQALNLKFWDQTSLIAGVLKKPAIWLDSNLFHLGYLPDQHTIYFSDNHFGVILTLAMLILAAAGALVWTYFDKTRPGYNKLYYWFCNYLAYYLFLAMYPYAIQKIIPIQAHYPTGPELITRWGDMRNWEVLFRFMGTSPAYCMFCGWLEMIASVLVLFNRTRVFGGLLMVAVLAQVVLLNVFYNNNIILLSGVLLAATIFILGKSWPKLYSIFIRLKPVSLEQYRYSFTTPWKKIAIVLLCFIPVWRIYKHTDTVWEFYERQVHNQKHQQLYNVAVFQQENDSIPSSTIDTSQWKYVCFTYFSETKRQLVKFDMKENMTTYPCKWDSANSVIHFGEQADSMPYSLAYKNCPNGILCLEGNWNGRKTKMELTKMPIDSMTLIKDTFLFMQEDQ